MRTIKDKTEVMELGGLHIIGTERHESRRIDQQLRGRAGRQVDNQIIYDMLYLYIKNSIVYNQYMIYYVRTINGASTVAVSRPRAGCQIQILKKSAV